MDRILMNSTVRDVYLGKHGGVWSGVAQRHGSPRRIRPHPHSQRGAAGRRVRGVRRCPRAQWNGQDDASQDAHGVSCPRGAAASSSTGRTSLTNPTYARARRGLGYVPQGREIFPGLSVRDNPRMGFAGRSAEERIDSILGTISLG